MPYFTVRPQILQAVQWTGSNFAALEDWADEFAPWFMPMTLDGDTITLSEMSGGWSLTVTDWLSNQGPMPDANMAQLQEITGTGPFSFDITAS